MIEFKDPFGDNLPNNQLMLSNGKIIIFNSQQIEALDRINNWLKSDRTFFTLMGYAGTGKSTVIKKIIDEYRYGICVSATTHKARKVIENTTGREGKTLHSLLGLSPDVSISDFDPNFPIFNPINPSKICDYNFIIIDESSQINFELFKLLKEKASKCNVHILFMGDSYQIPPIGHIISPIFNSDNGEVFELTKVERQQDTNPLLYYYDDMRKDLNAIDGGFKRKTSMNTLGEGALFTINKEYFRNLVIQSFSSEEFKKDSDYCKGIAWKNNTVMAANKIVRNSIIGENVDVIEKNDLLMAYKTITNEKQNYNIIENSADYHVIEKSKIVENSFGIKGYKVKLKEDLSNNKFKYDDVFIIDSNDFDNLHKFAERHDIFRDMAKSNKKLWKKYYEFRRNNLLMVDIEKYRDGALRNTGSKITKELDYGYFITSQDRKSVV